MSEGGSRGVDVDVGAGGGWNIIIVLSADPESGNSDAALRVDAALAPALALCTVTYCMRASTRVISEAVRYILIEFLKWFASSLATLLRQSKSVVHSVGFVRRFAGAFGEGRFGASSRGKICLKYFAHRLQAGTIARESSRVDKDIRLERGALN